MWTQDLQTLLAWRGVPIFSVSYDYFFWDTRTPTAAIKTMDNGQFPQKDRTHEIPWNPHENLSELPEPTGSHGVDTLDLPTEMVLVRDYGRGDLAQWGRPSWSQLW